MDISLSYFCFLITELILYIFHLSLLILLIVKRNQAFSSPFFGIVRVVIAADLITYVALAIVQKLPLIPFIYDLYKLSGVLLPSILFTVIPYMTSIQFLGHLLLAFNRFTLVWFPLKQKFLWNRQWYTVFLLVTSLIYVLWKINEPVVFVFLTGTNVGISMTNKQMVNIYYILSTTLFISTTFVAAILNILTFFKFYLQKKTSSNNVISVKEKNLLYVSFFGFVAQLFRTSFNINRVLFPNNETLVIFFETIVPVLYDLFAWSSSISLFILSSSTRKEYKELFFCKPKNLVSIFSSGN